MKKIFKRLIMFGAIFIVFLLAGSLSALAATDWTGPYVGIDGSYLPSSGSRATHGGQNVKISGPSFGLHVGDRYKITGSSVVIGVEAGYQIANVHGSKSHLVAPGVTETDKATAKRVFTLGGILGIAYGNFLPYVTGGYAGSHGSGTTTFTSSLYTPVSSAVNAHGWFSGGGLEYHLSGPWSARIEYAHMKLKDGVAGVVSNSARVGMNYSF